MSSDSKKLSGVVIVDKPAGMTSARAVDRVKRLLPRGTKIGHAGTLDPFATGVLVLLIGAATRRCEAIMAMPKAYDATIKFGATTATDDPESPEIAVAGVRPVSREAIDAALVRFQGEVQQRPPDFSAIKVHGRRAYDLARRGETAALAARPVIIHRIEMLKYDWPLLELSIDCGRGTYIRSLARDLGESLGIGGHLTQLRRTRVGAFTLDGPVALDGLTSSRVMEVLRPFA